MRTVHNKTARPLRVPLPHGKFLHLQPFADGAITDHAVDFPPLVKLAEAGEIEIHDSDAQHLEGPHAAGGHASSSGKVHAKRTHPRGDR